MRIRLIHDAGGEIVSFVPPGAELPGPVEDGQTVSEVEVEGIDPNDVHLHHLRSGYRVDCAGDPPGLVPRETQGTPRSGAGRPLERSATFPPRPVREDP